MQARFLKPSYACVLILVLMEDTLREDSAAAKSKRIIVLILVLMEDTLRVCSCK